MNAIVAAAPAGENEEEELKWQASLSDDLWGSYTKTKDVQRLEKDGGFYFRILMPGDSGILEVWEKDFG